MASDRPTIKAEEPENKDGHRQNTAADNQSLLDFAVRKTLDPALKLVTNDQKTIKKIEDGAKDFIKMAPLFMHGRLAIAGTIATYVTDEIKRSDSASEVAVDAALGAAKAGSLLATQKWLGARNTTPSLMGVEMGIVNRATDTGFTRQNYYDSKGNFDLKLGFDKAAFAASSSVMTDFATFGAADAVWGRMFLKSRGAVTFNPVITSALTASTFNVTTAAGAEASRQFHEGKFDASALFERSLSAAAVGLAAGGLAGMQRRSALSTEIVDPPNAITEARSTPFQSGRLVDKLQGDLKNGKFVAEQTIVGPNNLSYTGKVQKQDGSETPAILRVTNGTSAFEHRQRSEIGAYGLSKMMGLPSGRFPPTVATETEIGGAKVQGFLQEMKGENLKAHFDGKQEPAEKMSTGEILKYLRQSPELVTQLQSSWTERLIFGEWDNHSLNHMVHQQEKIEAFNIDLGDGFRPATTSLDHVPHPGLRKSYDSINSSIYRELARTKFDPVLKTYLDHFVKTKDTVEGRKEIGQLGFTPQEVDGIIGRAKWLAEHQRLPKGNQSPTFQLLTKPIKQAIKGVKFIKNSFASRNNSAESNEQMTVEEKPND